MSYSERRSERLEGRTSGGLMAGYCSRVEQAGRVWWTCQARKKNGKMPTVRTAGDEEECLAWLRDLRGVSQIVRTVQVWGSGLEVVWERE